MSRGWAVVAVLALFLAGISIGALGMHLYQEREGGLFRGPFSGPPPRAFFTHLQDRLGLTPEQRREIALIRRDSWRESESLRRELRPRLEGQMKATQEKILAVLTPEQRKKLEEILGENPRAFHRFFLGEGEHRPGPPPPPPPEGPVSQDPGPR